MSSNLTLRLCMVRMYGDFIMFVQTWTKLGNTFWFVNRKMLCLGFIFIKTLPLKIH